MTVTLDAITTEDGFGASTIVSHTIGVGTDTILIVCVMTDAHTTGDGTVTSVTWNGASLTKAISRYHTGTTAAEACIWYKLNPDSGTHDVTVDAGPGNDYLKLTIASYFGIKGACEATASTQDTGGTSVTTSILTVSNNAFIVDSTGGGNAGAGPTTPGAGQTQISELTGSFRSAFTSNKQATIPGSYNMTWDNPSGWISFEQAVAAFPTENTNTNSLFFGSSF